MQSVATPLPKTSWPALAKMSIVSTVKDAKTNKALAAPAIAKKKIRDSAYSTLRDPPTEILDRIDEWLHQKKPYAVIAIKK
jgi:hypothetical protein